MKRYDVWQPQPGDNELGIDHSGKDLFVGIKRHFGVSFVTGLPCGELKEFIATSSKDQDVLHLPATNERESVGMAAGAYLAGEIPLLYMQNSGLFECSNDLASLLVASQIPAVFVVSWRGAPGETATQHLTTGNATIPLLESFGLPYSLTAQTSDFASLKTAQSETKLPVFFLKTRESFNTVTTTNSSFSNKRPKSEVHFEQNEELHSREDVLKVIANLTPIDRALFSSTGLISRSLYHHYDSSNQFYNAGAFGLTSSIALGFALNQPDSPTTIVEGDGSVLTNIGNLNLIGNLQPPNFLHIVLDNKAYLSCSGEPTMGSELIPEMAALLGYRNVFSITSLENLANLLKAINQGELLGPTMIHVRINQFGERQFKRPLAMADIAERFKLHFTK